MESFMGSLAKMIQSLRRVPVFRVKHGKESYLLDKDDIMYFFIKTTSCYCKTRQGHTFALSISADYLYQDHLISENFLPFGNHIINPNFIQKMQNSDNKLEIILQNDIKLRFSVHEIDERYKDKINNWITA